MAVRSLSKLVTGTLTVQTNTDQGSKHHPERPCPFYLETLLQRSSRELCRMRILESRLLKWTLQSCT